MHCTYNAQLLYFCDNFPFHCSLLDSIHDLSFVCPLHLVCLHAKTLNVISLLSPSSPLIFDVVLKHHKVYNAKKLFGVTTLDVVRANAFVAENQKLDVDSMNVTVVGGHAGTTILPLLSQGTNRFYFFHVLFFAQ